MKLQASITEKVMVGLYSRVSTVELDNLIAEVAASLAVKHPDHAVLAARIAISGLHKETKKSFSGKLFLLSYMILLTISLLCKYVNFNHSSFYLWYLLK